MRRRSLLRARRDAGHTTARAGACPARGQGAARSGAGGRGGGRSALLRPRLAGARASSPDGHDGRRQRLQGDRLRAGGGVRRRGRGARVDATVRGALPWRAARPVHPGRRCARCRADSAVPRRADDGPGRRRAGDRRRNGRRGGRRYPRAVSGRPRALGRRGARRRGGGGPAGRRLRASARAPRARAVSGLGGSAMPLRFGVHIPTCIEVMMYPVPFARPEDILPTAQLAERVGFDSVWGNDHMTTQRYVQREWPEPPNFYEPLITFTWVAARTERIKLATGIIVLPMRTMPVLAKQVATLDQLSGGRMILGVGTGAYREEYEALYPDARDARRGEIVDEGMRALRLLFT